jgi:putative Holliday junction resolvase
VSQLLCVRDEIFVRTETSSPHSVDEHRGDQRSVDQYSLDQPSADQPNGDQHSGDQPLRPGIRLAIDVGLARIGVAACDPGGLLASPVATVSRGRGDVDELARLTAEREAMEVVVGLPTGLSGREGKSAADARGFAAALAARIAPVPVRLVDERFTTVLAHDALRRGGRDAKARRPVVDQAAAALLLQSALDTERSTGLPAGEPVADVPARGGTH